MSGRDLIALTGARRLTAPGRRKPVIVVRDACRSWARSHQPVLRAALADPTLDVDLTADLTWAELTALGGERLPRGYGLPDAWTCGEGDDALHRRILGLAAPPPPRDRAFTVPEIYERHPGLFVIVRRKTDHPYRDPVFKGAYRG